MLTESGQDFIDKNTSVKTDCKQQWHEEVFEREQHAKTEVNFRWAEAGLPKRLGVQSGATVCAERRLYPKSPAREAN